MNEKGTKQEDAKESGHQAETQAEWLVQVPGTLWSYETHFSVILLA